jgi:hypothetical protein
MCSAALISLSHYVLTFYRFLFVALAYGVVVVFVSLILLYVNFFLSLSLFLHQQQQQVTTRQKITATTHFIREQVHVYELIFYNI